jgi:hypothetical protein
VGVLVNLLIAPPLYVRPASEAIAELARRMARYSTALAAALRQEWSKGLADVHLAEARNLGGQVARADRQLARTEESARLNPRGRVARQAQPRLRSTLLALEHTQVGLRNLARALLDRAYFVPDEGTAYTPETRAGLARVLEALAVTLEDAAAIVEGRMFVGDADGQLATNLAALDSRRDELGELLMVDPRVDPGAWVQHGALLNAVDRLRVEISTAVHPSEVPWRPQRLSDRPREAVRRAWRSTRGNGHDA